jgi:hypothetical protein
MIGLMVLSLVIVLEILVLIVGRIVLRRLEASEARKDLDLTIALSSPRARHLFLIARNVDAGDKDG